MTDPLSKTIFQMAIDLGRECAVKQCKVYDPIELSIALSKPENYEPLRLELRAAIDDSLQKADVRDTVPDHYLDDLADAALDANQQEVQRLALAMAKPSGPAN